MIEIILGIVVVISFLFIIIIIFNNKFQFAVVKIEKAEEDISMYLQKKEELLNRAKPIISKEIKKKDILTDLENISVDADNFEFHLILKKAYNEFFKLLDENEKLLKSKSLIGIIEELDNTEENIVGSIKFYNDTVVEYNKLVIAFPSNIIAFFKRFHKKSFYNNEKRENFEILNH